MTNGYHEPTAKLAEKVSTTDGLEVSQEGHERIDEQQPDSTVPTKTEGAGESD